jgi:hypothetical protein
LAVRVLGDLALLLAVAFLAFTQQGQKLAISLFMRAHEQLAAYLTGIFQDSL